MKLIKALQSSLDDADWNTPAKNRLQKVPYLPDQSVDQKVLNIIKDN